MKDHAYICNICHRPKREINRWWIVYVRHREGNLHFTVTPWDEHLADEENVMHLCGEGCVMRKMSEFMAEAKG